MKILNKHSRELPVTKTDVAQLMTTLASPEDRLWPIGKWPRMSFDRGLEPGAVGGHGPIRYEVEEVVAGRKVVFRFRMPGLFRGIHFFEVRESQGKCSLTHVIQAKLGWYGWLLWPMVVRPLHDALVEDAFDRAEWALTGQVTRPAVWSAYVRLLRRLARLMLRAPRG